jgi:hypothetical protein
MWIRGQRAACRAPVADESWGVPSYRIGGSARGRLKEGRVTLARPSHAVHTLRIAGSSWRLKDWSVFEWFMVLATTLLFAVMVGTVIWLLYEIRDVPLVQ